MSWVKELHLANFRCYEQAALSGLAAGPIVLHGPNGAGKTNVLEAVSFLSPGRGMRGVKTAEVQKKDATGTSWAVSARAETAYGEVQIGTGADPVKEGRRAVRINGAPAKNQNALAEYLSCVWLTPQMDGLFIDAASSRRRFLDRLIFAFDAGHAGRTTRYENALRQRARLLQENGDQIWITGLEETMAESGVAIAAARADFVTRLQQACLRADEGEMFPKARLAATGTIEELLSHAPAVEVEEMFKYQLKQSRAQDAANGGAATGPHRGDFAVRYAAKDMPADQCSTGEQKALLIGIVLAHARLIHAERGAPPILLLDEVAAHLDEKRRAVLHEILLSLGGQVWLTGTDKNLFADLKNKGTFFSIENSMLEPDIAARAA